MNPPRAFVSWSSGKDSAFALDTARHRGLADIVGVLTTTNEVANRVAMHAVRNESLDRQVAALGLPSIKVPLPYPCSNEVYEQRMAVAVEEIKAQGVRHMVFGDLFLEDIPGLTRGKTRGCRHDGALSAVAAEHQVARP
jgi:diphthamide synthase (EF-2-diphthine--ammonia ligase)